MNFQQPIKKTIGFLFGRIKERGSLMIENRKVLNNVNALLKYENVKDYLFINVINVDTHKQELENMPHTIIGDLAIIYRVMIQTTDERFCSAKVTNQMMDEYGIDVATLHKDALVSSPKIMIPKYIPIETFLLGVPENVAYREKDKQLIIVSNEHNTGGAASMFYPNLLNEIASKLDRDLYIIPSSTDEVLVLSDSPNLNQEHVKNTLHYVNNTIVDEDLKLSDTIYHYSKEERVLEKADDYQKRIHKQQYLQILH